MTRDADIAAISPFVEAAIALADAVLDRPFADPDDDAAMAARALLRIAPTSTLALLAATPSVEPKPPYRRDLAETLCFLDHRHDEPSCPKGRHEADRIYRALEARYAHRAAESKP